MAARRRADHRPNPAYPDSPQTFRGHAPAAEPDGRRRIVCLGGSTTYGTGVDATETWPSVAERQLTARGVPSEVINAGVEGYGSQQLLVRYHRDIAPLHPTIVVIYEGWNRTGAAVDPGEWVPMSVPRPDAGSGRRLSILLARHSLLLQRAAEAWVERSRPKGSNTRWGQQPLTRSPPDRHQERWTADMRQLAADVRADGEEPVFVQYPALFHEDMTAEELAMYRTLMTWDPDMLPELGQKHAAIAELARETGSRLIPVQDTLREVRGAERVALFLDRSHLTVAGNQIIGLLIGNALWDMVAPDAR